MADSPSHKFGQELGNLLEDLVLNKILLPRLLEFAQAKNYYLDWKKERKARKGKRVIWEDKYGNSHDLDFVIEENGSEEEIGKPLAFIETAWRRYTKHSRNKAQEIQGAILPIRELHELSAPFMGVVLAGEFTESSLKQLESNRFSILHIPYEDIVKAFASVSVNIRFDEKTHDADYLTGIQQLATFTAKKKTELLNNLIDISAGEIAAFMNKLKSAIDRHVTHVAILPLFGSSHAFASASEALQQLEQLEVGRPSGPFCRFEVVVDYSNGDVIRAAFAEKESLVGFLKTL